MRCCSFFGAMPASPSLPADFSGRPILWCYGITAALSTNPLTISSRPHGACIAWSVKEIAPTEVKAAHRGEYHNETQSSLASGRVCSPAGIRIDRCIPRRWPPRLSRISSLLLLTNRGHVMLNLTFDHGRKQVQGQNIRDGNQEDHRIRKVEYR